MNLFQPALEKTAADLKMTLGSIKVAFKRPAARSSGSSDASVSAEFKKKGAGATDLTALKDSVKTGVLEKVTDAIKSGDGAVIPKTAAPTVKTDGVIKEPTKTGGNRKNNAASLQHIFLFKHNVAELTTTSTNAALLYLFIIMA